MAYADAIKYNRIKSMRGLPIGAIVPWSTDQSLVPTGWIVCNGTVVQNTRYPLLFKVIGNVYGGTEGSTFRLPPLTNSPKGIVDIYKGHYGYLKTMGEAHAPRTSTINSIEDPFWNIVGGGTNEDTGSSTQTTWISTIDVEGQFNSRPNMQGLYDPIAITQGEYTWNVAFNEVTLSRDHLQLHTHGMDTELQAPSIRFGGGRARACSGSSSDGTANCTLTCNQSTGVTRLKGPVPNVEFYANIDSHLDQCFSQDCGGNGYQGGGGGGTVTTTTRYGETNARVYQGGDGRYGGKTWFTSLSNPEGISTAIAPHTHSPINFNMKSRINLLSPSLKTDITMGDVNINNSPGRNFGTIIANTATAYLEMVYIIRAF